MSAPNRLGVGIHFDLICPWCFIGKRQFELARRLLAQTHPDVVVEAQWQPMQLLPEVPEHGLPFAEFYERRLGSPQAVRRRREQIATAARTVGLELDLAGIERLPNTARAHQLLRGVTTVGPPALYEAVLDRLFVAYFQGRQDIGDAATLRALAAEFGVPAQGPAGCVPDDARTAPGLAPLTGVPHFVFNGGRALSGAHDASVLHLAMTQAVAAAAPPA